MDGEENFIELGTKLAHNLHFGGIYERETVKHISFIIFFSHFLPLVWCENRLAMLATSSKVTWVNKNH